MKKFIFSIVTAALLLFSLIGTLGNVQANPSPAIKLLSAQQDKIDPAVSDRLNSQQSGAMLTVIVTLRQQADLSKVGGGDRAARLQGVVKALHAVADGTQQALKRHLDTRRTQGLVQKFTPLWVLNGFSVTATSGAIQELAQDPDVLQISSDEVNIVPTLGTPEPNISAINAPALWNMGFYGQGIVVANLDSGVDVTHPDLAGRWRGGTDSWFDPYGQHPSTPTDLSGHGTWTMGVMLGGDAGGTTIGVAPSAKWIAAKIFNDAGTSTATAIHQSFQWLLDPDGDPNTADAPQVVNNSWSYGNPGCYLDFEPDLQSLRAAGILPVFAAGNGGPYAGSSYSPANNPSAFAVGATNNNGLIYGYSSRGPSTCGGSTGPFPKIVAPGVNIRSSDLFGGYAANTGTSLAAPHVAGALALLLSAFPNTAVVDQEKALTGSAVDMGVAGPDDTYGYGRLDILAAYNWLMTTPPATATPLPAPTSTPTATAVPPTATATPLPPTATATPLPPTATATPLPPTATYTPLPPTATFTPLPVATMHVGDLTGASVINSSSWNASVTILVHDASEKPLANASVTGKWTLGASGTVSCITNSIGTCKVTKTGLSKLTLTVTFSVTNVTKTGLTYTAAANHDPNGDSNGTTIIVHK